MHKTKAAISPIWSRTKYDYDANGYRVRSVADGIETYFVRDETGAVLSEFRRAVGETDDAGWDKDYIYAIGQTAAMVKNELPATPAKPWIDDVTATDIILAWSASSDPDVVRHRITRTVNGTLDAQQVLSKALTLTDKFTSGPFGTNVPNDPATVLTYSVEAVDAAWNYGDPSPAVELRPYDNTAPPPPTNLVGEDLDQAIRITWDAPVLPTGENDLWGYHIERAPGIGPPGQFFILITTTPVQSTTFLDFGLTNGNFYRYRVRAIDTAGNLSDYSDTVGKIPKDEIPPGRPFGLTAQPGMVAGTVVLTWAPVLDPDLKEYQILRSTDPAQQGTVIGDMVKSCV